MYIDEVVYVTEGDQDDELDNGTVHLLRTTPVEGPVYQGTLVDGCVRTIPVP